MYLNKPNDVTRAQRPSSAKYLTQVMFCSLDVNGAATEASALNAKQSWTVNWRLTQIEIIVLRLYLRQWNANVSRLTNRRKVFEYLVMCGNDCIWTYSQCTTVVGSITAHGNNVVEFLETHHNLALLFGPEAREYCTASHYIRYELTVVRLNNVPGVSVHGQMILVVPHAGQQAGKHFLETNLSTNSFSVVLQVYACHWTHRILSTRITRRIVAV